MSRFRRLIVEAHRRSLWQVLLIYLGASYAVLEAVDLFTDRLGLPAWLFPTAAILLLIGLPIVLATAMVEGADEPAREARGDAEAAGAEQGGYAAGRAGRPAGRLLSWRNAIAGAVIAFALWGVIAAGWLLVGGGRPAGETVARPELDPNVVAVLPFRAAGADPAITYLREGMVDLLAAKLTGEGGPRAVDPRAAISAWNRAGGSSAADLTEAAALELARSLGAGRVLLGGLVGTAGHVVLNASLITVSEGDRGVQASVEGSTDSLTALVDGLTAQLLARGAGESGQRLASLTSTSLPALRAYLEGQATYRSGRYVDAERLFREAIDLDPSFALAALGLVSARHWTRNGFDREAISIAWSHRQRLSERDAALLTAMAGPNFPQGSPYAEMFAAFLRAVDSAPDRPEAWYWLGESYYHNAPALGYADAHRRAEDAFRRAFELDSTFSAPVSHLIDGALMRGDREAAEQMLSVYRRLNPSGEFLGYEIWQLALTFADSAVLDSVRGAFPEMDVLPLRAVVRTSMLRGYDPADAERAAAILRQRPAARAERLSTLSLLHDFELNRGRPAQALAVTEEAGRLQPEGRVRFRLRILDALYGEGDTAAAVYAVDSLLPEASARLAPDVDRRASQFADVCTVEQWRLWHGEFASAPASIERLRSSSYPADSTWTVGAAHVCASILEAVYASATGQAGAERLVAQLDSLLRQIPVGTFTPERLDRTGTLAVARLLESQGDLDAAYRALQRREFFITRYLASYLRDEGRLAALLGERQAAVHAYRHYLTLRSDPEPALADEVEQVRTALARLTGESGS
jgi:tetratricopeptide (TPR) repeat protein